MSPGIPETGPAGLPQALRPLVPLSKIRAIQVSPLVSSSPGTRAVRTPGLNHAIQVSIETVPRLAHRPLEPLEDDVGPAGSPETFLPLQAADLA